MSLGLESGRILVPYKKTHWWQLRSIFLVQALFSRSSFIPTNCLVCGFSQLTSARSCPRISLSIRQTLIEPPAVFPLAWTPPDPSGEIVQLDRDDLVVGSSLPLAAKDSVTRTDELAEVLISHIPGSTPGHVLHPSSTWERNDTHGPAGLEYPTRG